MDAKCAEWFPPLSWAWKAGQSVAPPVIDEALLNRVSPTGRRAYQPPGISYPLLSGIVAACPTVWVTFAPCFLWIFLGAPCVESLRKNRALSGALAAITAAVVGVVLNLALWCALHALFGRLTVHGSRWAAIETPDLTSLHWPCSASCASLSS